MSAVGPVQGLGNVAYGVPHVAYGPSAQPLVAWNAKGPGAQPNVTLASAQATGAALGSARPFDAGGFAQTSPLPAWAGTTSSVMFTRQVPGTPTGLRNEVVAADPATGALSSSAGPRRSRRQRSPGRSSHGRSGRGSQPRCRP